MRSRALKVLLAAAVCAAAMIDAPVLRADESPDAIVQHMRSVYGALNSYSDRGKILKEYTVDVKDEHTFTTYFNRAPRHFLLDFRKAGDDRFVIWGDPDAFHTWWKTTAQQSDYPNPNNIDAINLNDVTTSGAANKIPTLLYSKAPLVGPFTHFSDPSLDGMEDVGGQKCYRIVGHTNDVYGATGKEVNFRKLTLWIDSKTYLLRQVREETKAPPGSIDRTTTTYEPQANPAIPDGNFKFTPPESE